MTKTLAQMIDEVVKDNTKRGWYDKEVSFPEAMALLHSEVSEALEAWRAWGTQDGTYHVSAEKYLTGKTDYQGGPPKPEGVGSEFADILIRLLDYCHRFGIDLVSAVDACHGRFGIMDSFGEQMNTLHLLIAMAHMAWDEDFKVFDETPAEFAKVYVYLTQLCEYHGIDLDFEYERKMAYNRTRAYRHGGKRILWKTRRHGATLSMWSIRL